TFFLLSDGDRFAAWTLRRVSSDRRETVRRAGDRAWSTIGGYLRGAALLGVVEAALIGITLAVAGGGLVAPVMALTFVAAFVPIVGAIVAGVIAVIVALVTEAWEPALPSPWSPSSCSNSTTTCSLP
ncbi:MAG: AI-2E family transporter, partial [Acidimicrobiia bacterium]